VGRSRFDDVSAVANFEQWIRSLGEAGYRGAPHEWLTLRNQPQA
jgi:hypothetical protein